uniref:NADH-ubiquinone oxidoreductase chain 6 n=1 Tax=Lepidurus apus lubbocki TaxID=217954 RepID=A0A5B7XTZ3_9CRUS|nr:NADH dehydrogenase subunit 6 [Lepidurus apus lubbocki]QCZ36059.1 NADH dehydrogenase subunit 6 [Lepidurus apus lubbocki]
MMTYNIMSIFLLLNSFLFLTLSHPLSMGLSLIFQTLLVCLMSGTLFLNYWFSYTLFLIFLGGLLVLFIYISSLASNEMFKFNTNNFILNLMFSILIFMIINSKFEDSWNILMTENWTMMLSYKLLLSKIYTPLMFQMTLFLITYLLLCLMVVVNITKFDTSPLRLQK